MAQREPGGGVRPEGGNRANHGDIRDQNITGRGKNKKVLRRPE